MTRHQGSRSKRIVIVGAGFSGMGCAIQLLESGFDNFVIYEKNAGVGGTWETNRYPGLTCDVPAIAYTYSFERSCEFSRQYPAWFEIRDYCRMVSKKYGLEKHIRFGTEIVTARFHDHLWHIETKNGGRDTADLVVMATGVLRNLNYPDIEGLHDFEGPLVHTGRWDEDLCLEGKRVGVIGTGATSTQLVPAIVEEVGALTLFQRSAQWVAPFDGGNPLISEGQRKALRDDPEALGRLADGMLAKIQKMVDGILLDENGRTTTELRARCQGQLDEIADPELRTALTPSYQPGCKRLIWSETFYGAMQRPNAELVTEGIERIEANGIRCGDGTLHELDVIVLATGYRMHDYMRPMNIHGEGGASLDDTWADGEFAHRGIMVPGFPNMFLIMGPNSPFTNFSVIEVAEWQIAFLMQLVRIILQGDARSVQVSRESAREFNDGLKSALPGTIWTSGCQSYYLDRNGIPNVWPDTVASYRESMRAPVMDEFILD